MIFGFDIFAQQKATERARFFKDIVAEIAENPNRAYRSIESSLAHTIQHDTPIFGRRYTEIWTNAIGQLQVLFAVAERAARIEQIAKTQEEITYAEETMAQIINGTYDYRLPYKVEPPMSPAQYTSYVESVPVKQTSYLAKLKERLMAEKYGPLTWVPEFPESRSYYYKPLTREQIAVAVQELDRR
jgi:hypothetical protein